jgi:hypothetical protein
MTSIPELLKRADCRNALLESIPYIRMVKIHLDRNFWPY